jgi:adenine-specific DNA-methyltransferase
MARTLKNTATSRKTVETLLRDTDRRRNIPTNEFESVAKHDVQSPVRVAYKRRNRALDSQLVGRVTDEQDWTDRLTRSRPTSRPRSRANSMR